MSPSGRHARCRGTRLPPYPHSYCFSITFVFVLFFIYLLISTLGQQSMLHNIRYILYRTKRTSPAGRWTFLLDLIVDFDLLERVLDLSNCCDAVKGFFRK